MSHKTDMLDFISDLANEAMERKKFVFDMQTNVGKLLGEFQDNLKDIVHEHKINAKELRRFLATGEQDRLKEMFTFKKLLSTEGQDRLQTTRRRMHDVQMMLGGFAKDLAFVGKELLDNAIELRSNLEAGETQRLITAAGFAEKLRKEQHERSKQMHERARATQKTLHGFQKDLAQEAKQQRKEFAKADAERQQASNDRQEIRQAWEEMSKAVKLAPAPGKKSKTDAKKAPPHMEEASVEMHKHPTHPPADFENHTQDMMLKVKAVMATFGTEGCRFSELHRNMENISKSHLRDVLTQLMEMHEIRRDEHDRYHMI